MVPGPVQAGAVAAFDDDDHVDGPAARYRRALDVLAGSLAAVGLPTPHARRGFYLWVPVPDAGRGSRLGGLAEALAVDGRPAGSPGDLYGPDGAGFVRVAVVQPMDRLELVAERLPAARSRPGRSRTPVGRAGVGRPDPRANV